MFIDLDFNLCIGTRSLLLSSSVYLETFIGIKVNYGKHSKVDDMKMSEIQRKQPAKIWPL